MNYLSYMHYSTQVHSFRTTYTQVQMSTNTDFNEDTVVKIALFHNRCWSPETPIQILTTTHDRIICSFTGQFLPGSKVIDSIFSFSEEIENSLTCKCHIDKVVQVSDEEYHVTFLLTE
ncbi:MAG: hypothetical protein ACFFCQ_18490 [Promethearchaeota archaeon]